MGERLGPVVAGLVVVAVLVLVLPETDTEPATARPTAEEAFLAAYERSRTVELVVVSVFTRTLTDGRQLSYDQRLVQRPPGDRLVIGAGTASGRIDGRTVRCNADPAAGGTECVQGDEAPPYEDEVRDEVTALAGLVARDDGAYEVATPGDAQAGAQCFDLTLVVRILTPPYGRQARFCFDAASGALALLEVERPEATDRTEAESIRTTVEEADLRAADLGETISTG